MTLQNKIDEMLGLFEEIKHEVRSRDKRLFERWKAGGFIIDSNILSMYPNIEQVLESLDPEDQGLENEDLA